MNKSDSNSENFTKGGHIGSKSGNEETDYSLLREHDKEPDTGKIIGKIIMNDHDYIVFLEENGDLEWSVWPERAAKIDSDIFGEVVSKVTELEGLSETFDMSEQQKMESKILLGAALVLMFEKAKAQPIREVLKKAETYVTDRMTEAARKWYLSTSSLVTLVAIIGMFLIALLHSRVTDFIGPTGYDVLLGTGMGAIGALISVITRSNKLFVSLSAGRTIHRLEAGARVIVGMLGALLIALAVKSEIFFSVLNTASNPLAVLLTVCTVAGASERIVPSLIKKVENITEEEKAKNGSKQ